MQPFAHRTCSSSIKINIFLGKCNVHLTGYLDPEFEEGHSDGEEEDDDDDEGGDEVPALMPAMPGPGKNKRKPENSNDDTANKKAKVLIILELLYRTNNITF